MLAASSHLCLSIRICVLSFSETHWKSNLREIANSYWPLWAAAASEGAARAYYLRLQCRIG
jgi:hypothetical protein